MEIIDTEYNSNSELISVTVNDCGDILVFEKSPVRCKDCRFHHWEQEPCHGKTEHFCSVLKAQVFADFYCYHGKRKDCADNAI